MTTPRQRKPPSVQSFGPELMAALISAANQGFSIRMPYNKAIRLRARLYSLRSSMEASGHEQYTLVSKVRITITPDPGTPTKRLGNNSQVPINRQDIVTVTAQPADLEFSEALRAAGVDTSLGDLGTVPGTSSIETLLGDK